MVHLSTRSRDSDSAVCRARASWTRSSGPSPPAAGRCRSSSQASLTRPSGCGYRLTSFENVLGVAIEHNPEQVRPPGIDVRVGEEDEFDGWLEVVAEGFAHTDSQGVPSHEDFPRSVLERAERDFAAAGVVRYVALCDGVIAGGASLRTVHGVAQLLGAATAPASRRRGIHSALLSARLVAAATAECDIAVVTTQPGSKSQQNVQRRGFDLLYTRAVLVRAANRSDG
jgi:GNAT superfamily N-acetyltransferase